MSGWWEWARQQCIPGPVVASELLDERRSSGHRLMHLGGGLALAVPIAALLAIVGPAWADDADKPPTHTYHADMPLQQARDCVTAASSYQIGGDMQPVITPWHDGFRYTYPNFGLFVLHGHMDVEPNPAGGVDFKDYSYIHPRFEKALKTRLPGCEGILSGEVQH